MGTAASAMRMNMESNGRPRSCIQMLTDEEPKEPVDKLGPGGGARAGVGSAYKGGVEPQDDARPPQN
jgi:hypothetical protein